jgi:hypothetical protein
MCNGASVPSIGWEQRHGVFEIAYSFTNNFAIFSLVGWGRLRRAVRIAGELAFHWVRAAVAASGKERALSLICMILVQGPIHSVSLSLASLRLGQSHPHGNRTGASIVLGMLATYNYCGV